VAHVQAGAGIVADSVPERESAEVAAKAGAILAAIADAEAIAAARDPEMTHVQESTRRAEAVR
jgi:anthranilate synthase component 1